MVAALFWGKVIEGNSDGVPECIDGSAGHFAQCVFELGENLFYRVEVRAVGWQKAARRPGGLDSLANACDFMETEIVHHHDVAG